MTVDDEAVMPKVDGIGPKVTAFYTPKPHCFKKPTNGYRAGSDLKGAKGGKTWTFHIGDTYSR